ncbi:hypothetical protein DD237_000924 [Peronospora effusa]|uniref:RING-type domain-containing protein n=1 Tax=Peronospora effusa TaxID=542832 RepID=A0A425CNP9_9STRA|nr:hypothetical protein DD237_000924 [Peronospora effusa]
MNSFFVPEPNSTARQQDPQTAELEKRGNCKNYTLQMLADCARRDLPLRVSVSSATKKEDYVVYNCTISSVTTKNSWGVSYRYSEFLTFRNKVADLWTCAEKDCCGSCQAIRDAMAAFFPKKRPEIMSKWSGAVNHRKTKLENVLVYLLRCILLPGSAMKCFHARQKLPSNVLEFLVVKHDADKRSLLQVFVDNHQPGIKKSATTTDLSILERKSTLKKSSTTSNLSSLDPSTSSEDVTNEDHCMICLDLVGSTTFNAVGTSCSDSSPIVLQCKHTFHRKCIFEWLLFQYECPLCRAQVGPTAIINYCRLKNQPNEMSAPQAPKRPKSKLYTLKELRPCVGNEQPLQEGGGTQRVYHHDASYVTCQYSKFLSFRNQVEEMWTCHDDKCQSSCQSLRDLIEACYPDKAGLMSTWSFTVKDRKNKLKNVLIHLLRSHNEVLPITLAAAIRSVHVPEHRGRPRQALTAAGVSGQPLEGYEKVCESHWSVIAGAPQFRHEDDDPSMKKAATMT